MCMMNHSKLRYVFGFLFLILLVGIFYLIDFLVANKPYETLQPESYEVGTTVSLYDKLPRSFPVEFVLPDFQLDSANEIKTSGGVIETTVSFTSLSTLLYIVNTYRVNLAEKGWTVVVDSTAPEVMLVRASKEGKDFLVTLAMASKSTSMITIQYEK